VARAAAPHARVAAVRGDHSLKQDTAAVAAATVNWLAGVGR
jgi:hypothetical protein